MRLTGSITGLLLAGVLGAGLLCAPAVALADDTPTPSDSSSATPTTEPTEPTVPTVSPSPSAAVTPSASPSTSASPVPTATKVSASPTWTKPPCAVVATPKRPSKWGEPATVTWTATGSCAGVTVSFQFWVQEKLFAEKNWVLTGPASATWSFDSPIKHNCFRVRAVVYVEQAGSDKPKWVAGDDDAVCPQAATPPPSVSPSPSHHAPPPPISPSPSTSSPAPMPSVSPSPSSGSLPFTGTDSAALALTALGLLAGGAAMVRLGRNPKA